MLGVGIGIFGVVWFDGVVFSLFNFGWMNFLLEVKFGVDLDLLVFVCNDVNVVVFVEYIFGEVKVDFMLIKIGCGVGVGFIIGS